MCWHKDRPNMILWLWEASRSVLCHENVCEKVSETAHSYKYTSTDRKPSDGEIITMCRPQNAAANYVRIITSSKSMSGGGLRGGCSTTHSHTHACTHIRLLFILSTVIVSPHARCVSAQELTAWGAGHKAWEWLHESYLESVSLLHTPDTCRTTHSSTEVYSYINTHTHVYAHIYARTLVRFRHSQLCPNFKHISKTLIIAMSIWRFCIYIGVLLTNVHNQKGFIAKSGNTRVCC